MKVEKPKEKYDQLIADGYCVINNVLQEEMLSQLRSVTNELLDAQTDDERDAHRSSGSMISVCDRPRPKGRGFRKFMRKLSWYQQGLLAEVSLTPSPPKVATPTLNCKIDRINQDSPLRVFLGI